MNLPEDVVYLSLYKWHHGCEIVNYQIQTQETDEKWLNRVKENCGKVVVKCKLRFHAIVKRKRESFQYLFVKEGYYMGILVKMCVHDMEVEKEDEDFLRAYIQSQITKDANELEIETQNEVDGFLTLHPRNLEVPLSSSESKCCIIL